MPEDNTVSVDTRSTAYVLIMSLSVELFLLRLNSAKRDNDFIYHEAEPAGTALPEVKGKYCLASRWCVTNYTHDTTSPWSPVLQPRRDIN